MRNLAEQKKITIPIIWAFIMAIVYAIIFVVLFLNTFDVKADIFGYRFYDYMEESAEIDPDEVDEGEKMLTIKAGSKILVKAYDYEKDPLEKNDVFAFIVKNDKNEDVIITQVFYNVYAEDGESTIYLSHDVDSMNLNSYNIVSGNILGKQVAVIPYLGLITEYLCYYDWLKYLSLVLLAFIMVGIPIWVCAYRVKMKNLGSPFPEGVNINKLSIENLYIYENMRQFLLDGGMKIDKGYDCDLVYVRNVLFGVLHVTNGNVYININKDFQRYDNKLDRSGYICIPRASSLETAKKRVNSIYKAYFANLRVRRRRAR